ncbi:unnamed protein product [Clonostachys rosea f. rosea IK726]|uniref:Uncharacterized protein n=2 Tax=Bionectria ochroleuca TaxID=29856 RepID=A0A0B7KJ86_BIOOC|nr:unnamed protein product [Clonostachys rosea f. rosea IK726]
MSLLQGTSAFITGAASGIGEATALAFAEHGATKLALTDINGELLHKSVNALKAKYPHVEVLEMSFDVRVGVEVEKAIADTVAKFGRLDIAVNNAGIGGSGKQTHMVDEEEWLNVVDVNLNAVRKCQKEQLKVMLNQEDLGPRVGRGNIINLSSMYGLVSPNGRMHNSAYVASKHGVMGLTKGDANSYGSSSIRINAVCPGYVDTPLLRKLMDTSAGIPLKVDIERTPLKRLATMDEVADSITFLASPMSSFINGVGLVIDGGFSTN